MPSRLPKFGNVTPAQAKDALEGYTLLKDNELKDITVGDNIKYSVEGVLKGGGVVKTNKFPNFIVIKNKYKNISWCMQLTEPSLLVWIKTQENEIKENEEKKKIWQLYKAGKLMQINKDIELMKEVYEHYKNGKLVYKK